MQDSVLIAARAGGIATIDGSDLGITDDAGLRHSCAWIRALGFDGMWVIQPAPVETTAGSSLSEVPSRCPTGHGRPVRGGDPRDGHRPARGPMLDEAIAVATRRVLTQMVGDHDRSHTFRNILQRNALRRTHGGTGIRHPPAVTLTSGLRTTHHHDDRVGGTDMLGLRRACHRPHSRTGHPRPPTGGDTLTSELHVESTDGLGDSGTALC